MRDFMYKILRSFAFTCWITSVASFYFIDKTEYAIYLAVLGIFTLLLSWEFSDQPEDNNGKNETY